MKIHEFDVLLYKKHPQRSKKFLDVKFGFLVNPVSDWKRATGRWVRKRGKLRLSSPQGVVLVEGKTIFHEFLIFFLGLVYVAMLKLVRLYASIKFGKLLI